MDPIKAHYETAEADHLRARVIAHMCENLRMDPGAAELNADMPERLNFSTVAERVVHMSDPKAMVGELEITSTAKTLGRSIHVHVEGSSFNSRYTAGNSTKAPLMVK